MILSIPSEMFHSQSAKAPGTDDDELFGYPSEESVTVGRSLWGVAHSDEHKLDHKLGFPIHSHEGVIAKAERKRRASTKTKRRLGDLVILFLGITRS